MDAVKIDMEIAIELARIGCCYFCVLRFLNIDNINVFTEVASLTSSENENQASTRETKTLPKISSDSIPSSLSFLSEFFALDFLQVDCIACLGIFTHASNTTTIQQISKKITQLGYNNFSSYELSLELPVSTLIRQFAIWNYIKSKFDLPHKNPISSIVDLNKALKFIFLSAISKEISAPFILGSEFQIRLYYSSERTKYEEDLMGSIKNTMQIRRKARTSRRKGPKKRQKFSMFTRVTLNEALPLLSLKNYKDAGFLPPPICEDINTCPSTFTVKCSHKPILVAGNYLKLKRGMSQTPWHMNGINKTETSVEEEIIRSMLPYFGCEESKFHSSGREDVDVRMLGKGRPFVVEIIEPHLTYAAQGDIFWKNLEDEINAGSEGVQINSLHLSDRAEFSQMNRDVSKKKKTYRCVVWLSDPILGKENSPIIKKINAVQDLVVYQQTPIRVLGRRTLLTREKMVHKMVATYINPHFILLDVKAAAGTYIKEFVHGDRGRTVPSIGSYFGCNADILQLDVLELHL